MKKIHIAFLSEHVYSLFNTASNIPFGGAEVDLYNLAVYLAQNPKFLVTFYVGDFGQKDEPEVYHDVQLQKIKMFGWHQKSLIQKATFYKHLWRTLWKSDADIILTEMASHLAGWAAIFFKVLKRKNFIHRLASDRDSTHTNPSVSGGRRIYYLYLLGLKKADVIYSQTLQQQFLLKEKMGFESLIAPNGFFINPNVDFENKKNVLWVGRCSPVKRPELFIELAKRLPKMNFVMIMQPPSVTETVEFKQKADQIKFEAEHLPNMNFKVYIPFSEIQRYYNEASLFVNTSILEGFPNAFIQACLGGTPIASLKVDPDEFISKFQLGVSCQDQFEVLVEYVSNLSKQEMNVLGANALDYVKKHHDIANIGKIYEDKIIELVNARKGAH